MAERKRADVEALLRVDHVQDGVDQRQVRERLREVAEVPAAARVDLLGVEAERARVREQLLAEVVRARELADLDERRDEPERADRERSLGAAQAVVGLGRPVAEHEPVDRELVRDREHRGPDARVVRRQEADERHQQHGGVERRGLVVLAEDAALIDGVGADVRPDLVGARLPARRVLEVAADLGQPRAAVCCDPAHQLRGGEVLRLAADLPDSEVRVAPVGEGGLDLPDEDRPHALRELVARLRVQVEGVEDRSPDVVLVLLVGVVADSHRACALVAGEVVERPLGQLGFAADAVHDLEPSFLRLGELGQEVEEVVRFPVEAERVQAPEHERCIPNPRVAVVPVAFASRRFGQRGRGCSDEGARGLVGQALERERAPLQECAPGMVREVAVVEPVLPVVRGPDETFVRLLVDARRRML